MSCSITTYHMYQFEKSGRTEYHNNYPVNSRKIETSRNDENTHRVNLNLHGCKLEQKNSSDGPMERNHYKEQ